MTNGHDKVPHIHFFMIIDGYPAKASLANMQTRQPGLKTHFTSQVNDGLPDIADN
jgi:hypothetical protein